MGSGKSLLTVLALLAVWGVAAARAAGGGEAGPAPAGPPPVVYLEGEVMLDGQQAVLGQKVPPGATLQTGARSYCEIVFGGKNIFRVQEQTLALFDVQAGRGAIDLRQGALAAVFYKLQRLGGGEEAVRLITPTAVAGVRGTVFFVMVESPTRTYVCTCNGTLRLADVLQDKRLQVSSSIHKAYRFSREGGRTEVRSAPLLYHDSATMDSLARRIRVSIPWGSRPYGDY
jgi:hypothetical protein